MESTERNLRRVIVAYERNFERLKETVGTARHKRYVRRERRLNNLEVRMRRDLHLLLVDPCPLRNNAKACYKCTGWFKDRKETKAGVGKKCFYQVILPENVK